MSFSKKSKNKKTEKSYSRIIKKRIKDNLDEKEAQKQIDRFYKEGVLDE